MKAKLYVELDALLDTRETLLKQFNLFDIDTYLSRQTDNFKYLGYETFLYLYSKRNRVLLNDAKITPIYLKIADELARQNRELARTEDYSKSSITLNIHPYIFVDDELELLIKSISSLFGFIVDINIVNKEPGKWILKEHFGAVTYQGMHLLTILDFEIDLQKNPIPDFSIVAPALVEDISSVDDYTDYFVGLTEAISSFIDLDLIHPENFSNIEYLNELAQS